MPEQTIQSTTREPILEVKHLQKSFGNHQVLKDIDFSIYPGDVTSIIGASGSGKSTLLRCINVLETPSGGEILHKGVNILDKKITSPNIAPKWEWYFKALIYSTI